VIGDPLHHGREVASRREQGRTLDDIPAGGVPEFGSARLPTSASFVPSRCTMGERAD
jgi:hypothetical protein